MIAFHLADQYLGLAILGLACGLWVADRIRARRRGRA